MNDLIINGIDHSKFDLEWANHGGIIKVYILVYKQPNTIHQYEDMSYFGVAKFIDDEPDGTVNVYMLNKRTAENKNTKFLAMATPSECAEAGIEYIEPPARWLPIESAPKDGRRILIKEYGTVFVAGWGYVVDDIYGWVIVNDCYIEHSDNLLWMEPPKDKFIRGVVECKKS